MNVGRGEIRFLEKHREHIEDTLVKMKYVKVKIIKLYDT